MLVMRIVLTSACCRHTSYLSRTHGRCPCKFFLASVNFYRFNAKNWHFRQILREKVAFFGVNFILQKFCSCKKNDKYQVCKDVSRGESSWQGGASNPGCKPIPRHSQNPLLA